MIQATIFYLFATVVVASGLMVILAKNPVHSVLWLILAFFNAAGLFLVIGAEFIAMILVIVYVGAVAVLFLFVVMMLDIDVTAMREGWVRFLPVGLLVAVVMLVQMLLLIGVKARSVAPFPDNAASATADVDNTRWLAEQLFTGFILPFEFAAVILTVAVIAAVMLTLRRRTGNKSQNPGEQTRVKASDRLRMVSMPAEKPAPATAPAAAEGEGQP